MAKRRWKIYMNDARRLGLNFALYFPSVKKITFNVILHWTRWNEMWFQIKTCKIILSFSIICFSFPFFRLAERIQNERILSDFFIDASHELSLFAWNNGKGHKLTMAPYFCLERKSSKMTATISKAITMSTKTTQNSGNGNGCAIYSRNHDNINRNYFYSVDTTIEATKSSFVSTFKLF